MVRISEGFLLNPLPPVESQTGQSVNRKNVNNFSLPTIVGWQWQQRK